MHQGIRYKFIKGKKMPHFFKKINSKEAVISIGWSLSMAGLWAYSFQQMFFKADNNQPNKFDGNLENQDVHYPRYD